MRRVVFTDGRPDFLREMEGVEVLETYQFGDDGGALIECEDEDAVCACDGVQGIERADHQFMLRTIEVSSTNGPSNVATIDDVRQLHSMPNSGNTGKGITVVVMDTGVDPSHPIFANTDIKHVDCTGKGEEDRVGHGTACAGQIVRLAPDVDIISLKILEAEGTGDIRPILRGYEWLLSHTGEYEVVNMSWGAPTRIKQLDRLQDILVDQGIRDVVAAGNTGDESGSPATADNAFSAGACDEDGNLASFSSYNPSHDNPDVTAIGEDVRLAQAEGTTMGEDVDGKFVVASGTSFAAPETAGAVARVMEMHSLDIPEAFEEYADDIPNTPRDGAGLLKYTPVVENEPPESAIPEASATVWSLWSGGQDIIYMDEDWFSDGKYTVRRIGENRLEFMR